MNYLVILEAIIVITAILSFIIFMNERLSANIDYRLYFIEDLYASLIAMDKANLINNTTLLCEVVRYLVPKEFNVTVEYNNSVVCLGTGKEKYRLSYLFLNGTKVELINISILK